MVFQCINIRQVPREVLKTAASSRGFQHLPRDLANVNAWKSMFDPCIIIYIIIASDKAFFPPKSTYIFLICPQKHALWILIRYASLTHTPLGHFKWVSSCFRWEIRKRYCRYPLLSGAIKIYWDFFLHLGLCYKTFFMLSSAVHEICTANKSHITNNCKFFHSKDSCAWKFLC